jgi:histidinol-phosphatase
VGVRALNGGLHRKVKATGVRETRRFPTGSIRLVFEDEMVFAMELADHAAQTAMGLFRRKELEIRTKADQTLVTEADTSIERAVRERIANVFPDDRVLGEEEGGSHDPSGRVWVVDPIDGTANFARGVPIWATLIALQVDGDSVVGVASAPALNERYAAQRGHGATMNDHRIRVSDIPDVGGAHLLYAELKDLLAGPYAAPLESMIRACWRDRGFGDFWAHVLIARGAAEIMFEPALSTWDYAALQVIVEEAGGRMTTFEGEPVRHGGSVLTTNGVLHDEVLLKLAGAA